MEKELDYLGLMICDIEGLLVAVEDYREKLTLPISPYRRFPVVLQSSNSLWSSPWPPQ